MGVGFLGMFSPKKRFELVVDVCDIVYEKKHITMYYYCYHVC